MANGLTLFQPSGSTGFGGEVTYSDGFQFRPEARTFEQQAETRRRAGLRDLFLQQSQQLSPEAARRFEGIAAGQAQQQLAEFGRQFGRQARATRQNILSRGLAGSATVETETELARQKRRGELGIAAQAQQTAEQLKSQERQRFGGLASYLDQLRQQQFATGLKQQQTALDAASAATGFRLQGQSLEAAARRSVEGPDLSTGEKLLSVFGQAAPGLIEAGYGAFGPTPVSTGHTDLMTAQNPLGLTPGQGL